MFLPVNFNIKIQISFANKRGIIKSKKSLQIKFTAIPRPPKHKIIIMDDYHNIVFPKDGTSVTDKNN